MTYRRGFKAEAERIAVEIRAELGLDLTDALDVHAVADHLGLPIVPLSGLSPNGGFQAFFQYQDPESFSAITIFSGTARLIVHNDAHHPNRQHSNIAHEIGHCLLEHEPAPLVNEAGCRYWNDAFEAEADWLGGALLVPRDGGLCLAKRGWDIEQIAAHYGVSDVLCRWRLHQTGVIRQLERFAGRRRW